MITGVVEGLEARVPIRIKGSAGQEELIVAVVDTGFTGSLTLPPALVIALQLRWQKVERGTLADGSECLFDVYDALVVWNGRELRVPVDETDTDPLVGMALLSGHSLSMEVRPQGSVEIRRLPSSAI